MPTSGDAGAELSGDVPTQPSVGGRAKFDDYAQVYSDVHQASIALSGESTEYFHAYKADWIARELAGLVDPDVPVLDFGGGTGNLTRHLLSQFHNVTCYDPSSDSIATAAERLPGAHAVSDPGALSESHFGLAVLANVLHHVPPPDRRGLIGYVTSLLRPGGLLVLWEHNPYNPLTRKAVADCEFDDDAVLLKPKELRALLQSGGLTEVRRDWVVFFPAGLAKLRPLEPRLRWLPLGAQCVAVGCKSDVKPNLSR